VARIAPPMKVFMKQLLRRIWLNILDDEIEGSNNVI